MPGSSLGAPAASAVGAAQPSPIRARERCSRPCSGIRHESCAEFPPLESRSFDRPVTVARFSHDLASEPGWTTHVEKTATRQSAAEPTFTASPEAALQWQYAATHADVVPEAVIHAAAGITIAVIDTGADLAAPDLAAKTPLTYNVRAKGAAVSDPNGHGTFVASLADELELERRGHRGRLGRCPSDDHRGGRPSRLCSRTSTKLPRSSTPSTTERGSSTSASAVQTTSSTERRAINYAVAKGVLLVAAVGNSHRGGNPVEYPAALLQPVGSRGIGGRGLSVGASTRSGARAAFSNTGTHISLAAPGEAVFGAVSAASSESRYPRVTSRARKGLRLWQRNSSPLRR